MIQTNQEMHDAESINLLNAEVTNMAATTAPDILLDSEVVILDPAASPSSCSEGWLTLHQIKYTKTEAYDPPRRVRTANGIVKAYYSVRVPFYINGQKLQINVIVLDTTRIVPLLFGSNTLLKASAQMDFSTGIMLIPKYRSLKQIKWKRHSTAHLWYIPLTQKSPK